MICKNRFDELWCECGNRIDEDGFFPVDAKGDSVDEITGDEKVYQCDRCKAIVHLYYAQVRDEPGRDIREGKTVAALEVRTAGPDFIASCGHGVLSETKFVRIAGTTTSYCPGCGLRLLADKLR
jgi:hypothetical protein